jgi:hypothetical protein
LTIQSTSHCSIITIINWHTYQDVKEKSTSESTNRVPTEYQPSTTNNNDNNDNNTPPNFFELKKRYSDPSLIEKCFAAIATTRKSGKVADSVLLAQLQKWQRYPTKQVETGIKTYLEKDCAGQGKAESYLMGIIRNQNGTTGHSQQTQPEAPRPKFYSVNDPASIKELYSNE